MPRKRMIKPEFWTDPKILALKRDIRLFFIGIWNFANDEGIIENNLVSLKVKIFPGDEDIKIKNIESSLSELLKQELIIKGTDAKGHKLLKVTNWSKQQKISHPTPSEYIFEPIKEEELEASNKPQEKDIEDSLVDKYSIVKNSIDKDSIKVKDKNHFDHFYYLYPRKVKKKKAELAFKKLSKKDKTLAIEGLIRYNLYWTNNNIDKSYIPHPTSWLNSRQWEDEISTDIVTTDTVINPLDVENTNRQHNIVKQSSKLRHYLKEAEKEAGDIPDLLKDFKQQRDNNVQSVSKGIRQLISQVKPDTSTNE